MKVRTFGLATVSQSFISNSLIQTHRRWRSRREAREGMLRSRGPQRRKKSGVKRKPKPDHPWHLGYEMRMTRLSAAPPVVQRPSALP